MSDRPDPGPWTVKGVAQADRDMINAAARRAAMPVGPWLVMAASTAIDRERTSVMTGPIATIDPAPGGSDQASDHYLPVVDFATLLQAVDRLPKLTETQPQLAKLMQRVVTAQLRQMIPGKRPARPDLPLLTREGRG